MVMDGTSLGQEFFMSRLFVTCFLVCCIAQSASAQIPPAPPAEQEEINNLPPGPDPEPPNPNPWWPAGPGEWLDLLKWANPDLAPGNLVAARAMFTARTGGVPNVSPAYAYDSHLSIHEWVLIGPGNLIKQLLVEAEADPIILHPGDPPVTWELVVGKTSNPNAKKFSAHAWIAHSEVDLNTGEILNNWAMGFEDQGQIWKSFFNN